MSAAAIVAGFLAWLTTNPDEAAGAATGLLGAYMLARGGKRAPWGWVAFLASNAFLIYFARRNHHPGLLALQLAFTCTSALGIWKWLILPRFYWGEWRGDFAGNATMWIMSVAKWRGWRLDVHKMVAADMADCYHTHPAKAWRLVVWGGYIEELEDGTRVQWWPGRAGIVRPELSHRIASLPRGRSYSIWLRWPKSHDEIQLRGSGWKRQQQDLAP